MGVIMGSDIISEVEELQEELMTITLAWRDCQRFIKKLRLGEVQHTHLDMLLAISENSEKKLCNRVQEIKAALRFKGIGE